MNKEIVLVVGASSGIGKQVAIQLANDYTVIAIARRTAELDKLQEFGIIPEVFDVVKLDSIAQFVKSTAKEFGKIKSLVYCAGVQNVKPLRMLKIDEAKELFDVNYFGALFFAKAFSSKMVYAKNNPSITFISSIAGNKPEEGILNYSASKAAIDNLTKGLAKEIVSIRTNAIAPSFLKTNMTNQFNHIYTNEFIEKVEKDYPLGIGNTKNIANMVEFLISDKASYVTGEIIKVDGGASL